MRKQVAAANWKMNLTIQQAEKLLNDVLGSLNELKENHRVVFAVPFPYLFLAKQKVAGKPNVFVAAQNCSNKKSGAYTGETSVEMLQSIGVDYVIIGHSERREYFNESNLFIAEKIDIALENKIHPIFCCGESLSIREANGQNEYVSKQLKESLFHLTADQIQQLIISYEPIWAIGTGKTATPAQAQEMQLFLRSQLASVYGKAIADDITILYGGSVKGSNANQLFALPDVDGGLVGGASLNAEEFNIIINSLQ